MAKPKHIYVIDTCVVLHDPMALYKFGENDIYLPLAVIDDLDDIKTRPGNISWSAREVFRILDSATGPERIRQASSNSARCTQRGRRRDPRVAG